jgi:hypothetical protein
MSEQWRGHYARCLECENLCASGEPCRCCLAAEVEVLRAQVQRARRLGGAWEAQAREFSAQGVAFDLNRAYAARCLADALDGGDDVQ